MYYSHRSSPSLQLLVWNHSFLQKECDSLCLDDVALARDREVEGAVADVGGDQTRFSFASL
jgi:hypothetical protein